MLLSVPIGRFSINLSYRTVSRFSVHTALATYRSNVHVLRKQVFRSFLVRLYAVFYPDILDFWKTKEVILGDILGLASVSPAGSRGRAPKLKILPCRKARFLHCRYWINRALWNLYIVRSDRQFLNILPKIFCMCSIKITNCSLKSTLWTLLWNTILKRKISWQQIDWYQNKWPWPLFRDRIKVMSTIERHSTLNISETVRDRGLVPKDHQ